MKRPEDQYSKSKAREMIEQLAREKKKLSCKGSSPAPSNEIIYKNFFHAGIVTHVCCLDEGHDGKCRCKCGMPFYFIPQ